MDTPISRESMIAIILKRNFEVNGDTGACKTIEKTLPGLKDSEVAEMYRCYLESERGGLTKTVKARSDSARIVASNTGQKNDFHSLLVAATADAELAPKVGLVKEIMQQFGCNMDEPRTFCSALLRSPLEQLPSIRDGLLGKAAGISG